MSCCRKQPVKECLQKFDGDEQATLARRLYVENRVRSNWSQILPEVSWKGSAGWVASTLKRSGATAKSVGKSEVKMRSWNDPEIIEWQGTYEAEADCSPTCPHTVSSCLRKWTRRSSHCAPSPRQPRLLLKRKPPSMHKMRARPTPGGQKAVEVIHKKQLRTINAGKQVESGKEAGSREAGRRQVNLIENLSKGTCILSNLYENYIACIAYDNCMSEDWFGEF